MGGTADHRRLSVDDALAPIPTVRGIARYRPGSTPDLSSNGRTGPCQRGHCPGGQAKLTHFRPDCLRSTVRVPACWCIDHSRRAGIGTTNAATPPKALPRSDAAAMPCHLNAPRDDAENPQDCARLASTLLSASRRSRYWRARQQEIAPCPPNRQPVRKLSFSRAEPACNSAQSISTSCAALMSTWSRCSGESDVAAPTPMSRRTSLRRPNSRRWSRPP